MSSTIDEKNIAESSESEAEQPVSKKKRVSAPRKICEHCGSRMPRSKKKSVGPLNGYQYFQKVRTAELKAENPEASKQDNKARPKLITAEWSALLAQEREDWSDKAVAVWRESQ